MEQLRCSVLHADRTVRLYCRALPWAKPDAVLRPSYSSDCNIGSILILSTVPNVRVQDLIVIVLSMRNHSAFS